MMLEEQPWLVLIWFASGAVCAWIARRKNRRMGCWFLAGIALGPLAVLWIALLRWRMPPEVEAAWTNRRT